eukprot:1565041-Rhodomonas_salina.1
MHIQSQRERETDRQTDRGYVMTSTDIEYGAASRPASRCRQATLALRDWRRVVVGGESSEEEVAMDGREEL